MNVLLFTDVEGLPFVSSIEEMDRTGEEYSRIRAILAECITKTAQFCLDAGADKVYYIDGHAGGGNLVPGTVCNAEQVDKDTIHTLLAAGKIDCMIELGNHARAGTAGGFLDHTMNSRSIFSYKINGIEQSELSLHASVMAYYGVPTVLCIGDQAACDQAKEYIPEIYTAPVKRAEKRNTCICFENAYEIIASAVRPALENYKSIRPCMSFDKSCQVEITYYRTDMCEEIMQNTKCEYIRKDARTLVKTTDRIATFYDYSF